MRTPNGPLAASSAAAARNLSATPPRFRVACSGKVPVLARRGAGRSVGLFMTIDRAMRSQVERPEEQLASGSGDAPREALATIGEANRDTSADASTCYALGQFYIHLKNHLKRGRCLSSPRVAAIGSPSAVDKATLGS